MRRIFRLFGCIALVSMLLLAALFVIGLSAPMAPPHYTDEVATGGAIERTYLAGGDDSIKRLMIEGSERTKRFSVFYPASMEVEHKLYPVVVMLNGTGVLPRRYEAVFEHLASWGFVVIGNDDDSAGFGLSADETVELIRRENRDDVSLFCGKLDENRIGIVGHSQGGAGVLTALSVMKYGDVYKAAVALSPTHEELAHQLGWSYDLTRITAPILLLAGTSGDFETQTVIPVAQMRQMYDQLPAEKVMARRVGAEHGQMLYSADGYVTAWLMYHLQNDETAGKMRDELRDNGLYQDFARDERRFR